MNSVADVIYSHVNHVELIEPDAIDMFFRSIRKENQKTIDDIDNEAEATRRLEFEAYALRPKFVAFMNHKIKMHGPISMWSKDFLEKMENEFYERYVKK